jgi:cob(I)alamin adenosyltransferase
MERQQWQEGCPFIFIGSERTPELVSKTCNAESSVCMTESCRAETKTALNKTSEFVKTASNKAAASEEVRRTVSRPLNL